ncbi:hypothetical protein [Desulfuromonas acetoxidans]|uniref:hypothetical protein n=1 Tax=Desulfuromonas acetoxidans TaxID=891 RepID=UPI002930E942|nr:hypothetical protein [Desulfuromonas acetoxidans]
MAKKPTDEQTTAALAVVDMEQKQEAAAISERHNREQMIAECHEMIGRIQGFELVKNFTNVGGLVWLKQVKETKIYKDLPNIGSWDKFCNYIGLSRSKVDEDLLNLATFGEAFLANVGDFSLGYRDLKKLRQLTHDGSVQIEAQTVTIGNESIPLDDDHAEDLQTAIESVLEAKTQEAEEAKATVRAKDRIIKGKEDVINKQEKELAKHEARAQKQGYAPGEEAFLQQMENARTTVDGYLIKFDPDINPLPEDATERMMAAYVTTLSYFKRVMDEAYAVASERYGHAELDDGWVPPNLRVVNNDDGE